MVVVIGLIHTCWSLNQAFFTFTVSSTMRIIAPPTSRPLPDTTLTGLERLIQNHRAFCWVDNNCNPSKESKCCKSCSCEPDCTKHGTCCPDVLEDFWTVRKPEITYQCVPLLYPGHIFRPDHNQIMIGECPGSFGSSSVANDIIHKM